MTIGKGEFIAKCFLVRCSANDFRCQKGENVLSSLIKTDYVASQIEKRTSIHQCVIDLPDCFKCRREGEGRREKGTSPTNSCTGPVLRNTRNSS